ncbi:MAG: hypothetical protein V4614_09415 [Pseudomonadota bacterium]
MNILKMAFAGVVILCVTGCAVTQETRQALAAYTQAMAQVDKSADMFLTDFSSGLKAQEDLKRLAGTKPAVSTEEYPSTLKLDVNKEQPQTAAGQKVAATRESLAAVRAYNEALLALAEGKPEREISQGATKLGAGLTMVGVTIPGLSQLIPIGSKLVKLAQDAHTRQQLEQGIREGSNSVELVLQHLVDQTPELYRLSVVAALQAQTDSKNAMRSTANVLKTLLARHGAPVNAELTKKTIAYQGQLEEIGARTRTRPAMPAPFQYTIGKPAYDAAADAEAVIFIGSLDKDAQKYAEVVIRQNAYHDLIQKYVALLRTTRSSLDALVKSLSAPVDLGAEASRLLGVAFDLRNAMAAYRDIPATTP